MLQTSWIQTPGANTLVGFLPLSVGDFIHRPARPTTPSGQQLDVYPCQGSNHTFCELWQRPSDQVDRLTGQVGCSSNPWVSWVNPSKAPQPESGEWSPPKGKQRHWHWKAEQSWGRQVLPTQDVVGVGVLGLVLVHMLVPVCLLTLPCSLCPAASLNVCIAQALSSGLQWECPGSWFQPK